MVALVITVIVLLILAGVSISLVVGNNGVLTQASNAVVKNREEAAREEVAMAVASAESDYWTDWAKDSSKNKKSYFTKERLQAYAPGIKYVTTPRDNESFMVDCEKDGVLYTFSVDENGKVTSQEFAKYYGETVLKKSTTENVVVENADKSVIAEEGWQLLYATSEKIYLIYKDYYPNDLLLNIKTTSTPDSKIEKGTGAYTVKLSNDTGSRDDLVNYLTNTNNWTNVKEAFVDKFDLARTTGITVTGSPTPEMWMASYNAKYGTHLGATNFTEKGQEYFNGSDGTSTQVASNSVSGGTIATGYLYTRNTTFSTVEYENNLRSDFIFTTGGFPGSGYSNMYYPHADSSNSWYNSNGYWLVRSFSQ